MGKWEADYALMQQRNRNAYAAGSRGDPLFVGWDAEAIAYMLGALVRAGIVPEPPNLKSDLRLP
jgi:hypothetical protein